jgi:hypothetical protein
VNQEADADRFLPPAILTTTFRPLSKRVSRKKLKAQIETASFAVANYRNMVSEPTPDGGAIVRFRKPDEEPDRPESGS